jgi:hypothetical protein
MKAVHETLSPQKTVSQAQLTAAEEFTKAKRLLLGIYRLSDPKISLASISAMFLGTCAAAMSGQVDWLQRMPLAMFLITIPAPTSRLPMKTAAPFQAEKELLLMA